LSILIDRGLVEISCYVSARIIMSAARGIAPATR
jgi:hypothetical protein